MLKWIFHRRVAAFERQFDYDMAYMHQMVDTSLRATMRFARFTGMAGHREAVPASAWFAAKLAATLAEDCGPCTQLAVTMAEREGMASRLIRAVIEADTAAMDADTRLGWEFARAVLAHDPAADELREAVVARWGPRALLSLAFVVAASRVFPSLKYALGHGRACTRVRVGGVDTRPAPALAAVA